MATISAGTPAIALPVRFRRNGLMPDADFRAAGQALLAEARGPDV